MSSNVTEDASARIIAPGRLNNADCEFCWLLDGSKGRVSLRFIARDFPRFITLLMVSLRRAPAIGIKVGDLWPRN
jgi:hypothetical protein